MPRFDSPSIFAAILDDEKGGRFQIKPQAPFQSHQAYLPNTNILQTTFQTAGGRATVTDFMPCYRTTKRSQVPFLQIHRTVECPEGEVAMEAIFEPMLDYARGNTVLNSSKYGVIAKKGREALVLSSKVPFQVKGNRAIGQFALGPGQRTEFVLHYGPGKPLSPAIYRSAGKLEKTAAYWHGQAQGCVFSGPWREAIVRSYLALHLLIYLPTGAIIAAATTSLPEEIGGERNWDYRYAWLRDASLTLDAFHRLGHKEEAVAFFEWLVKVCVECGPKTQILYNIIDYKNPVDERVLGHLRGYRDSRPVRIGNDAYGQRQLDVFGEVLEAAHNYLDIGGYISRSTWGLLKGYVDAACQLWQEPDSGIWEIRGGPYHFVHSKLMCWVALDRGAKIAEKLGQESQAKRWRETAENIRKDILSKGWNPQRQAFTQHYDTAALDASNLLMPLYGFLPISDERVRATIERTVEELSWHGLLRRYKTDETDDGLPGSEGAFLWCSFWLVRNLIRLGRMDEAKALYQRLLGYGNHLGLFSEMIAPTSGEALGNFPQALTHLAIIVTGLELTQAVQEKEAGEGTR
ncbi:MAG: glycoside hydrolase family 15 protein [Dehalococcoidia bacterium]